MVEAEEVVVFIAQGELEEQQVRSFLAAHDIPTRVRGEALRHTHSLTLDGLGQAQILVAREHEATARELLARVARGEFTITEDHEG